MTRKYLFITLIFLLYKICIRCQTFQLYFPSYTYQISVDPTKIQCNLIAKATSIVQIQFSVWFPGNNLNETADKIRTNSALTSQLTYQLSDIVIGNYHYRVELPNQEIQLLQVENHCNNTGFNIATITDKYRYLYRKNINKRLIWHIYIQSPNFPVTIKIYQENANPNNDSEAQTTFSQIGNHVKYTIQNLIVHYIRIDCLNCSNFQLLKSYKLTELLCNSSLYFNGTDCLNCEKNNCNVCKDLENNYCKVCNTNYLVSNGQCNLCSSKISNCVQCSSQSICSQCQTTYYFNNSDNQCKICHQSIPFCKTCNNQGTICFSCEKGFNFQNSTCNPCLAGLAHCLDCTNDITCTQCEQGFGHNDVTRCQPCSANCLNCQTPILCNQCGNQYYLSNDQCQSCIIIKNCQQCSSPTDCNKCLGNFQLQNGSCLCPQNTFELTNTCINIKGCISSHLIDGKILCIACNATQNYILSNQSCICQIGYSYKQDEKCQSTCGDGIIIIKQQQCDDNNNQNNDGCSINCKIQNQFQCTQTPFICKFKYQFQILFLFVDRIQGQNIGQIVFKIYPYQQILLKVNLSQIITVSFPQHVSYQSSINQKGIVIIQFQYKQSINDQQFTIRIDFLNSSLISKVQQFNFSTLNMHSPLTYDNYLNLYFIGNIMVIIGSILGLLVFIASLFAHKIIGVEIIHCLQIIFFSRIMYANQHHFLSIFNSLKYINSFNDILSKQHTTRLQPSYFQLIAYNYNLFANLNIILIPLFLSFLVYIIMKIIAKYRKSKIIFQKEKISQDEIDYFKFKNLIDLTYERFVFPISMFVIIPVMIYSTVMILSVKNQANSTQNMVMGKGSLIINLLIQIVLFNEVVLGFSRLPDKIITSINAYFSPINQCDLNRIHIPIYCIYVLIITLTIMSTHTQKFGIFLVFALSCLYALYFIIAKPFTIEFQNYASFINQLYVIYFIGSMIIMKYAQTSELINVILIFVAIIFLYAVCALGFFRLTKLNPSVSTNTQIQKIKPKLKTLKEIEMTQYNATLANKNKTVLEFTGDSDKSSRLKEVKERLKLDYRNKNPQKYKKTELMK